MVARAILFGSILHLGCGSPGELSRPGPSVTRGDSAGAELVTTANPQALPEWRLRDARGIFAGGAWAVR